jgi:hypothetical protein
VKEGADKRFLKCHTHSPSSARLLGGCDIEAYRRVDRSILGVEAEDVLVIRLGFLLFTLETCKTIGMLAITRWTWMVLQARFFKVRVLMFRSMMYSKQEE